MKLLLGFAVFLLAAGRTQALLATFVNYIYWGPAGYTARVGECPGADIALDESGTKFVKLETATECAERCDALRSNTTANSTEDEAPCIGFIFSSATHRCSLKSRSCGATVINGSTDTSMMFDIYGGSGCPVGFFGWNCSYYCSCANNDVCNPVDGSCPGGCSDHHWGWGCSLINTCFYDDEGGAHYKGSRYNAISGAMCQPWFQRQPHDHNLTDGDMSDGSLLEARNFCRNPKPSNTSKGVSVPQPNEPWCYVLDKPGSERETCYVKKCNCEYGRYGTNCELECPEGRYGQDCRFECQCNSDETCSKLTGKCQKCRPGFFGSGCLRQCHCRDSSEVCDYRTGSCRACPEGYGGVDCYTKLPFLSRQPWIARRSASTVTLAWQSWFECRADGGCGEGPVNGFIVEYHPKDAQIHKWMRTLVPGNGTEVELSGLHSDIVYELRVRPIHARWLQGVATTPVEFQLCGDPKAAPSDVRVTHRDCNTHFCEAEIGFEKIKSLADLNCDASKVSYKVSYAMLSGGKQPAPFDSVSCSHAAPGDRCKLSLGRLAPGTVYVVRVCASSAKRASSFFWKRLSESTLESSSDALCGPVYTTTLKTPHAQPSEPRNVSLSHVGPRRAFIEWQAPVQPQALMNLVYYSVQVQHLKVRACPRAEVSSEPLTLFANTTSAQLEPLVPFSDYRVTVYTHNPDNKSQAGAWLQFVTQSAPPEARPEAQLTQISSDFIMVAVDEPPCDQIHGEMRGFAYEVSLVTPRNGSQLIGGRSNETAFRISNLEPYSSYILTVRVVNSKGPGGPSAPIKFRTDQSTPAQPEPAQVSNVSADSLQLLLSLPSNPRADVRYIEVRLVDLGKGFREKDNKNVSEHQRIIRVDADTTGQVVNLAQLRSDTRYRIELRSVAEIGSSEWTEPMLIRTKKATGQKSTVNEMMAVYESEASHYLESLPLIAGVIASVLFVIMIFSGAAAAVIMWRRRLSRTMIPTSGSSLSRSCTSGGTSSPSSSTAADDVQGRWRTIPHFLQEMKGESMIYTTHDVIGLCDSPPTSFMPPGHHAIKVNTELIQHANGARAGGCSTSPPTSSSSPDSSNTSSTGAVGLLKKVSVPAAPPRPSLVAGRRCPAPKPPPVHRTQNHLSRF